MTKKILLGGLTCCGIGACCVALWLLYGNAGGSLGTTIRCKLRHHGSSCFVLAETVPPGTATELYEISCRSGDVRGCYVLMFMYSSGSCGVPKNPDKMLEMLEKVSMGRGALPDKVTIPNCLAETLASSGSSVIECARGEMHSCGIVAEYSLDENPPLQDTTKAVRLLEKACESDRGYCRYLAELLEQGEKVRQDLPRAASFYLRGCPGTRDSVDPVACTRLARLYVKGRGVEKNPERAVEVYQSACQSEQHDQIACAELGLMIGRGEGTVQDARKARSLIEKACEELRTYHNPYYGSTPSPVVWGECQRIGRKIEDNTDNTTRSEATPRGGSRPVPEDAMGIIDVPEFVTGAEVDAAEEERGERNLTGKAVVDRAQAIRVGGPIRGPKRLKYVKPVYPEIARQARVQGIVILECTISAEGNVTDVTVLHGIPLLDQAAIDAVKQWVYAPTRRNGVPVSFIMTNTVIFRAD